MKVQKTIVSVSSLILISWWFLIFLMACGFDVSLVLFSFHFFCFGSTLQLHLPSLMYRNIVPACLGGLWFPFFYSGLIHQNWKALDLKSLHLLFEDRFLKKKKKEGMYSGGNSGGQALEHSSSEDGEQVEQEVRLDPGLSQSWACLGLCGGAGGGKHSCWDQAHWGWGWWQSASTKAITCWMSMSVQGRAWSAVTSLAIEPNRAFGTLSPGSHL